VAVNWTLSSTLSRFSDQRILVVGDVLLDEYVTGDCSRLSPEAPVPILGVESSRTVLGGAANTAHNVVALGGHTTLVSAIGADATGEELAAKALQAGIDFVPIRDDRPTPRKVRVMGRQQQLLRLDYGLGAAVSIAVEDRISEQIRAHMPACSVVIISDYAKGLVTERLFRAVLEVAHAFKKPVILDPRPQHAAFYQGCDYITPNWKEAGGLLGRPDVAATPEAIDEVGRDLAAKFRSHVLLTLGAKGMSLFDRDGRVVIAQPAAAREVFDVSGAGDTVVATFGLALAAGCDHRMAVELANQAAGVVVGKLGTATVTRRELLADVALPEHRLLQREDLAPLAEYLRSVGKRVVTTNGSFDLLHAGHLHFLREARRQGDVLMVGINSDRAVRANKGADRPIVGEEARAEMLLSLRDVDYVHIFDEAVPMPFLEEVRPEVHVNGSEYGEDCIEAPTVRANGGRIHIVERLPNLSTSGLVEALGRKGQRGSGSG
jgi:D-beta-D-heptose 7-phosphate kinase/D-beta-D-heptose 1-phosphate adenosyltransferase